MNTPICDKEAWDCSDWDSGLPPELVVNLEVARKLETNLRRALEALKEEHEELLKTAIPYGQEGDRFMERRDYVSELIKELEEV